MQLQLIKSARKRLKKNLRESLDGAGKAFFVEKSHGRRFVLTDIHGSYQTFTRLLEKLDLDKSDQLFILGDLINRAPYSIYVIEKIAELLNEGFQVYPLRGNHEQLVLEFDLTDARKLHALADRQYSMHLLDSNGKLPKQIRKFFSILPYYYELDRFLLVHAGFDTSLKNPLKGWKEMLWIRQMAYDSVKLSGKTVIHGHVPTQIDEIKKSIRKGSAEIKLDNGCIRASVPQYGSLICLKIDSGELLEQRNLDFVPA
jgi:serine/threonine protein phosphatase 1